MRVRVRLAVFYWRQGGLSVASLLKKREVVQRLAEFLQIQAFHVDSGPGRGLRR
jgi:hypothetical protein